MQTKRLYKVVADDPQLFKEHMEVKLSVRFKRGLTDEQREIFRQIVEAWGLLGLYAPIPSSNDFEMIAFRDYSETEKRELVFLTNGIKYCGKVEFVEDREARVEFDLWTAGLDWLDVLLNCLESYHVHDVPIEWVELKPVW